MRAVVLAGGLGTRLAPLTHGVNKHLLPVAGEPMIFHCLRHLWEARINQVLIISSAGDLGQFTGVLGSGERFGLELFYAAQDRPGGIAHAVASARAFVGGSEFVVLLADNIFAGKLDGFMTRAFSVGKRARLLLKRVDDPQNYGVAELDASGRELVALVEKPARPRSRWAAVGAYRYGPDAFEMISSLSPSARGELEITDLNSMFLRRGEIEFDEFSGDWIDAGTHASYRRANAIVRAHQDRRMPAA